MTPEELWARLKPSKDKIEQLLEERGEYISMFGLTEAEAREFNEMFEESARRFREQHSHLEVVMTEVPIGNGRTRRLPVVRPKANLEEKDLLSLPAYLRDEDTRPVYFHPSAMGKSVDQTKRLADYFEDSRMVDEAHHFHTHHYEGGEATGKSIFRIDKDFYPEPPPKVSDEVSSGKPKPKMTNRYGSPFDFKPRKGKRLK